MRTLLLKWIASSLLVLLAVLGLFIIITITASTKQHLHEPLVHQQMVTARTNMRVHLLARHCCR